MFNSGSRLSPCAAFTAAGLLLFVNVPLTHADAADVTPAATPTAPPDDSALATVVVTARRLNEARTDIQTQTGASTYTIDSTAIAATPGGDNVQLNQVLLQAPDVVQDSFGQLHVRADHNDLQYRLNGIILPEGISVFSQTLSPRLISSLSLITGALPAEYGLRTAGIIDLTTNSGAAAAGRRGLAVRRQPRHLPALGRIRRQLGQLQLLRGRLTTSRTIWASSPRTAAPIRCTTTPGRYTASATSSTSSMRMTACRVILGTSNDELPDPESARPAARARARGRTGRSDFLSDDLNETQHELAQYAIVSLAALSGRARLPELAVGALHEPAFLTRLDRRPAVQRHRAGRVQGRHRARLADRWRLQAERSAYGARRRLPAARQRQQLHDLAGAAGRMPQAIQTSDVPLTVIDNGSQAQEIESVYLQDEWKPSAAHAQLRRALRSLQRLLERQPGESARQRRVAAALTGTTVHGGYSRYFTPPPFELVGERDLRASSPAPPRCRPAR